MSTEQEASEMIRRLVENADCPDPISRSMRRRLLAAADGLSVKEGGR